MSYTWTDPEDITAAKLNSTFIFPVGIICMWSGTIANIPYGWVLCNGSGGAPDLRAKFIRGAPASTEAGGTGGADTHTLVQAEMPAHTHTAPLGNDGLLGTSARHGTSSQTGSYWDNSAGGSQSHNNMPAYYELAYIQRKDAWVAGDKITPTLLTKTQSVPSGLIMAWSGLIANIPAGWVKCDGTNSTPDLRSRFIRGARSGYDPGATGGEDSHILTAGEMPGHYHEIPTSTLTGSGNYAQGSDGSSRTGYASLTYSSVGSGTAHENRPAYYELIFIMKS